LDNYEYSELLKDLNSKVGNIRNILKPDYITKRLSEIKDIENNEDSWKNPELLAELQKEKRKLETSFAKLKNLDNALSDAKDLFEMSVDENDSDSINALFSEAEALRILIKRGEVETMLSGETDSNNAILSIHPGAGGTESQDWASILLRMYLRWAERRGFKSETLDYQDGDEAGIKDVSILIKGENAYGYLKIENGIHRLVRISPFDSNARRHTSFASVVVSPEVDDNINIQIDEKDLRIDTYRSSGAGGQHVNKTESAIRITHIPTNVVVQCQNDRSQHKNRATAMKMLKSRLYELELEKQNAQKSQGEKSEIGWGHQIRSYVLQPYQQVKDSRSGEAYTNVNQILDGDIDKIIEDVLVSQMR
jgi:peptide chain release factor 2